MIWKSGIVLIRDRTREFTARGIGGIPNSAIFRIWLGFNGRRRKLPNRKRNNINITKSNGTHIVHTSQCGAFYGSHINNSSCLLSKNIFWKIFDKKSAQFDTYRYSIQSSNFSLFSNSKWKVRWSDRVLIRIRLRWFFVKTLEKYNERLGSFMWNP